jgi:hypothetical protein
MTAVPTILDAREPVGGHPNARQTVLARSAIASYARPTPIEIPIRLSGNGFVTERVFVARPPRPQVTRFTGLGLPGLIGIGSHLFIEPKSGFGVTLNALQTLSLVAASVLVWKPRLILSEGELVIKYGASRVSIPLESIRSVRDTGKTSRGIAAWFAGVEIKHGRWDSVQVWPVERDAFVASLRERNPAIAGE